MEDWSRSLLFVGTLVVVMVLGASWFFCLGLSDIVHWTYCAEFLARTQAATDAAFRLGTHVRDAVWRP